MDKKILGLLVVEGSIVSNSDSTIFILSRTVATDNWQTYHPEIGAALFIESNTGETFSLEEKHKGYYSGYLGNLDNNKTYRLTIKTAAGINYASDFVPLISTPLIDKVSWKIENNKIQVYANTHDPFNQTRYYKWNYTESWIFYSPFQSTYIWADSINDVRYRNLPEEEVFKCWGNQRSTSIYIGTSAKLNQDVITDLPLNTIPARSEKLTEKYSIEVRQQALTKEAYEFWQNLKKNTESIGSVFDSQPSEISGNIRNINNLTEPVIGYISAGSIQKKRIFIDRAEIPKTSAWTTESIPGCSSPDTVSTSLIVKRFKGMESVYIPIDIITNDIGQLLGYSAAFIGCVDCRTRGTNKKPAFWP